MGEITEKLKVNQIKEMISIYKSTDLSIIEKENIELMILDLNDKKKQLEKFKVSLDDKLSDLFNNGANQIDMEVQELQNEIAEINDSIEDIEYLVFTLQEKLPMHDNEENIIISKKQDDAIKENIISEENQKDKNDSDKFEDDKEESLFETASTDEIYKINDFADEEYEYPENEKSNNEDIVENSKIQDVDEAERIFGEQEIQELDEEVMAQSAAQDEIEIENNIDEAEIEEKVADDEIYEKKDENVENIMENKYQEFKESFQEININTEGESFEEHNDKDSLIEPIDNYKDETLEKTDNTDYTINLTTEDIENAKDIITNRMSIYEDPEDALEKGEQVSTSLMKNLKNALINE